MNQFSRVVDVEFFIRLLDLAIMVGMTQNIFNACISDRPRQEDDRTVFRWADFWAQRIAANISAVSDMLGQMDKEPELPDDLLVLFSGVLDVMRMNRENLEKDATPILELVEEWLGSKAASNSLDSAQKLTLCQAFIRAGLEPPDPIRIGLEASGAEDVVGGLEMPDIEALMRDLIPDDVTGYPAYMILREGVGAMPRGAAAPFVTQMVAQAVPNLVSLGRYCLLDPMGEIRVAAAEGFVELSHAGAIDAVVLSDLISLRKWLPDRETKSTLDRAIKEALRREATGGLVPRPWTRHRLVSSLPDGTGSQSIVASVSRGGQKCIATLLLKAGHGIKDAYAIPCTSASDQRRTLAEIEEAMPMHEVPLDYLPAALATALDDGLAKGLPPAPGFVDVAEMLGLDDIAPLEHGSVPLLDIADPEARLDGLSAAKRGRLIGQSIEWARDHEMSSSWFVTDAALSAKLDEAKTERQAEQVVWAHLEAQRDFWSSLFARSAAILRNADADDWLAFAAVVQGLETGRALKQVPIFEMIAALTLDVAKQGGVGGLAEDEDPFTDDDFDPGIAPEGTGELGRLLRKTPLSPNMIDGYLTAVIVAPRFVTPTDWLPPLLGEINFPGGNKLQRVLDIIMLRYGAIQTGLFDGDIGSDIRKRSARQFEDWLSGFAHASAITAAWPKRALSRDDQKILRLIKDGPQDDHIQATLKPLLPSWLDAMAAKAVDD
jgi:yecA family protein